MKFAVTADLQFDSQPRYSTLNADGISTRLDDTLKCFAWIVETATARGCDGLLVLGDIFDSRTSVEVLVADQVCRAFRAASKHLSAFVLVGNHDAALRHPRLNSLQMLAGAATVIEEPMIVGGDVAAVPWYDRHEAVSEALREVKKSRAKCLVSHVMVEGAVPKGKGIPLSWLDGWKTVLLGDVHEPKVLRASPRIQYVGAPLQIDFGDAGGARGFTILETTTGKVEFVENEKSPRFYLLTDANESTDEIRSEDFVRVRVQNPRAARAVTERVSKLSKWVEADAVPDEEIAARLEIPAGADDDKVLTMYAKHVGVFTPELVATGKSIIEEARK